MSKRMVPEELNLHIQSAIDQLSLLFSDWLKSHNAALESKATLVAFWVKDYCHFLRNEKCFSPQSVPRLKRGSVIVVDFGFRLGKEFGGRHFAAVLDNDNKLHSPIVTVVPLFSLKESYKPSRYTCYLPDGVYSALNNRITGKLKETQSFIDSVRGGLRKTNLQEFEEKAALLISSQRMIDETKHLKYGSVANTCQITTISKIRIKRPLTKDDPLYGLRLSANDMNLINNQIKELFVFPKS